MENFKRLTDSGGKGEDQYPDRDFPTVYSEGVASASRLPGLVKLFLMRVDSHPFGAGGVSTVPIMQLIMPNDGVIDSTRFLLRVIGQLVAAKEVDPSLLDELAAQCMAEKGSGHG